MPKTREEKAAWLREYRKSPKGRAAYLRSRQTPKRKEQVRLANQRAAAKRYPAVVARVDDARKSGCVDPGEHSGRLEFHHLDPSTKRANVTDMAGHSDESFWAEVAKCVVVCEGHHHARHAAMTAGSQTLPNN